MPNGEQGEQEVLKIINNNGHLVIANTECFIKNHKIRGAHIPRITRTFKRKACCQQGICVEHFPNYISRIYDGETAQMWCTLKTAKRSEKNPTKKQR